MMVKNLVKVVSGLVVGLSLAGVGAQVANADYTGVKLAPAEEVVTNPAIKKGNKIMVVVQDTKNQTVSVYNAKAEKTSKSVKMGSTFTAQAVKKVNGKKIVKVSANMWLNTKDVTKD